VNQRLDADRHTPIAGRDGYIEANGFRLHYLEWGDAAQPPVLLLHGGSAHAHWWDFVVPHLVTRHRCVALDLRGHGDSSWSSAANYGLPAHAADVEALIDALGLRQVALVGHSFGGFVAMTFARAAGARLAALVIVDSRARITPRSARYLDALRKLPHPRYASVEEALQRFRLLPAAHEALPHVIAHVVRHGLIAAADGTWTLKFDRRAISGTPAQDLSPAVAAVACPLLAIRGQHSPVVTAAGLEEFRTANPRAVTVEIASAHHHVMLDQPEALARAISNFLDQPS